MIEENREILNENLFQLILRLALPGILFNLIIVIQNFVDAVIAGQLLGESSFAAISITFPITLILNGLAQLIGGGSASVFSRAIGAQDHLTKRKVLNNLFLLTLIASVVCTFLGYIFSDNLIILIGGKNQFFQEATSYLKTIFLGSLFFIFGIAANVVIRSEAKIHLAMRYNIITTFTNIFISIFFVKIVNLKITGMAYGTVISMLVFSFLNLRYLIKVHNLNIFNTLLYRNSFSLQLAKTVILIGIPGLCIDVFTLFQHSLIFNTIAFNGTDRDIIFMGASLKAFVLAIYLAAGFSISFQPVAGINYGARNYSRVKKSLILFSVLGGLILIPVWLYMQLYPRIFIELLLPSFNLIEQNILHFRMIIFLIPIFPFAFCSIRFFEIIGNGLLPATLLFLRQILLFFPILYLCQKLFSITGIYLSLIIVDIIIFAVAGLFTVLEFKKMP